MSAGTDETLEAKMYLTGVNQPAGTAAVAWLAGTGTRRERGFGNTDFTDLNTDFTDKSGNRGNAGTNLTVVVAARLNLAEILIEDARFFAARVRGNAERSKLLALPAPIDGQTEDQRFASDCDLLRVLAEISRERGNAGTGRTDGEGAVVPSKQERGSRARRRDISVSPSENLVEGKLKMARQECLASLRAENTRVENSRERGNARVENSRGNANQIWLACSPDSLRQLVPAKEALRGNEISLRAGTQIAKEKLLEILTNFDYNNEALCEAPGQFAERGGLIDIYPLNASAPVRVDFFDDEIETIREFDPVTQRTIRKLDEITIIGRGNGNGGAIALARTNSVFEYFPAGTRFIFADADAFESFPPLDILREISSRNFEIFGFGFFDEPPSWLVPAEIRRWHSEDLESLVHSQINVEALGVERLIEAESIRRHVLRTLSDWQREGERVVIVCETPSTIDRLNEIIDDEISAGTLDEHFVPEIVEGTLSAGFRVVPDDDCEDHFTIATEREIFGRNRKRMSQLRSRKIATKSRVEQLLDFNELVNGDFIVHLEHGICIYRGIFMANPEKGIKEDMIMLEFDEKARLYVPFRDAHLLSRYIGLTKRQPKLAKLGSRGLASWRKTCRDALDATRDFAAEMLNLQARRQSLGGIAMTRDDALPWMGEFEKAFPYTETPDQAKAIAETKIDQERERPMDRLICGDVGFGKTEVAIRAAFKAVLSGYQVAILAPTTVLVQQHFNTFRDRFAHYPVSIEMLSRFRTPKQSREICKQIAAGTLDIVIGTHALLAKNVSFKKLGLLVIDEEHRFGVRQKEQIKQLREQVDVLTMSATPIPRTLYLAIMGARDLSVIETPPRERLPIQTIIKYFDLELIRNVVKAELERGGQVFYLHNRVDTIHEVAAMLQATLPAGTRIAVGHGQMDERDLERVMTDFVAGKFDVLVCTTIIETGLDIPNCNTLIIDGADRFGLSQLYQLRGRVGRFNRQAYAYLLLHRRGTLTGTAKQRLTALAQNNQLGAGFRIAMRDLELRGAGNILGVKQSGPIMGVGFELYCQLLRQSIASLKGDVPAIAFRAEMKLDFVRFTDDPVSDGNAKDLRNDYEVERDARNASQRGDQIVATIPSNYIHDVRVRIDIFRKIALAGTQKEIDEILDSMRDRFGAFPPEVAAYCSIVKLRCLAEQRGIVKLETNCGKILATRRNGQLVQIGNSLPLLSSTRARSRLLELENFLANFVKSD